MSKETKFFIEAVQDEIVFATKKFPWPNPNLAALMEEVGELSRAFLEKKSFKEIFFEAVQVAAMAARCAIEGDPMQDGDVLRARIAELEKQRDEHVCSLDNNGR